LVFFRFKAEDAELDGGDANKYCEQKYNASSPPARAKHCMSSASQKSTAGDVGHRSQERTEVFVEVIS
jgi:hypothetical protein